MNEKTNHARNEAELRAARTVEKLKEQVSQPKPQSAGLTRAELRAIVEEMLG